MSFDFIKCTGTEALSRLKNSALNYPSVNKYPFLVGNQDDLATLQENAESDQGGLARIVGQSLNLDLETWFQERRSTAAEYDLMKTNCWASGRMSS